jgi:hypothetical protein
MLDWAGIFQWRALGIDPPFVAEWSPDSARLLTHRLDQRGLHEQVLVESAPAGGGRPVEHRLLVVPGAEHLFNGSKHYVLRRTWDYFVRHLHGAEPPSYRLTPLPPSLPV